MPDAAYRPPEGYMTMAQAAAEVGVSLVTLRKLVQRRGVQVFQDPRDARAKLVKAEDVARLTQPIPIGEQKLKTAA
jgi:hypothetical protein